MPGSNGATPRRVGSGRTVIESQASRLGSASARRQGSAKRRPETPLRPFTPYNAEKHERGFYSDILGGGHTADDIGAAYRLGPSAELRSVRHAARVPGNAMAAIADMKLQKNDPRMHRGGLEPEPDTDMPRQAFQPKVQIAYVVPSGTVPRRVEMERQRRQHENTNFEDLLTAANLTLRDLLPGGDLRSHGKDVSNMAVLQSEPYLRLEHFDDTELDPRTPQEWLSLGVDSEGIMKGVPGYTLVTQTAGGTGADVEEAQMVCSWMPCVVTAFDEASERYTVFVAFDDGPTVRNGVKKSKRDAGATHVPRVHLLFAAENPERFVERIKRAYAARKEAEAQLRYNLVVDCMPTDIVEGMPKDTLLDIFSASHQYAPRFSSMEDVFVQQLATEINFGHTRATNAHVLQRFIRNNPSAFPGVSIPSPMAEVGVRTVDVPSYSYGLAKEFMEGKSFANQSDVLDAIREVKICCEPVDSLHLLSTVIKKEMRLNEFTSIQEAAFDGVHGYLKNTWIPGAIKAVNDTLGKCQRGWFNMYIAQSVYDLSRLKCFMLLIKQILQDSLRTIVLTSVHAFSELITATSACVRTAESKEWPATEGFASTVFKAPGRTALWSLDLVIDAEGYRLSTPVGPFEEAIVNVFNDAIAVTATIPDIEPLLLPHLFWVGTPTLESVNLYEPWLCDVREHIRTCIQTNILPLQSYVAMFEKYRELIELDVKVYLEEFMAEPKDATAIKNECKKHMKTQAAIEAELPLSVDIGLFHLTLASARDYLVKKCAELAHAILGHLSKSLRKKADAVVSDYSTIASRMRKNRNGIEELDTETTWLTTEVPDLLKQLAQRGAAALSDWDLLNEFKLPLSDDDFRVRWATFGWPKKVGDLIVETKEKMVEEKELFENNLVGDLQEFTSRINGLQKSVGGFYNHADITRTEAIAVEVHKIRIALEEAQKDAQTYNVRQRLFGMPLTEYTDLNRCARDFEPFKNLWITADEWNKSHHLWMTDTFMNLDSDALELQIASSAKTIHKCTRAFKDVPGCLAVAEEMKQRITEFQPYVPLIQALRNPGMRDRHWEQLSEKVGFSVRPDDSFTFTKCLELKLQDHIEAIVKVGEYAGKEFGLETALDKMEAEWKPMDLDVKPYKQTGTYIIAGVDEIVQLMDDHIVMTQAMSFSPYKKPFEERISVWERKLQVASEVIEEWLKVQQQWLYLEPIFSSDDIARQLPNEAKRYQTMYAMWRKALKGAHKTPNVISYCPNVSLLENFRESNKLLEQVQKGLSAYLESKRGVFARFYFLSDDELLEILSQTKDPMAVQPHMRKCFDNIKCLTFEDDLRMSQFQSADGEKVAFNETLYPKGNVEDWLLEVERVMRMSIREIFTKAWVAYNESDRVDWVTNQGWPGQIVIAGCQMSWTNEVAAAIDGGTLSDYVAKSKAQLGNLVVAIRGKLDRIARKVVSALIVIEVHAKDVVVEIEKDGVNRTSDFEWIKQLRYYWEEDDEGMENLRVKAVTAAFNYGYEYLGNSGRLVITPLTDRIYLTLTGALELIYGGAPAGPAGTGKTETTKDLAKAMAIQCVVFNCSDQLDFMAMAKFFKGLASAGAWACFDEFNRIDIEVLSVVAQQVSTIQLAIKAKERRFFFEGSDLQLRWTASAFITMNPGYAGRTELPDNLAALFRPVACMVPDYTMIAEIFLYSFGFEDAKKLSGKITTVFKLSSEQLSSQDHYDFGMRAVKTVITAAGNLKRTHGDNMDEDQIVLSAMKDVNEPKFLQADLLLFKGIVSDLFPSTKHKEVDYGDFKTAILEACRDMHLQPVDGFVTKVIQLYETTVVRHGLMLVGPTGSGKTRDYEVLARALTSLAAKGKIDSAGDAFTAVDPYVLNPKSITMGQLYGAFDPLTHEWTDGILSTLVRRGVAADTKAKKWFVFDGPVDAIWIENMNTVLDDNKKLCLASGEIIALTAEMTMMFEVEDLAVASPATVSRCGMVYLEPGIFGERPLQPFVTSWFETQVPPLVDEHSEVLMQLFDDYLEDAITFVRDNITEMNKTVNSNLCASMLKLTECFFQPFVPREGEDISDQFVHALPQWLEYWFIFSLVWSVGASCYHDGRVKFDKWLRERMVAKQSKVLFPSDGLVYDYCMLDDGVRDQSAGDEEEDESAANKPIVFGWQKWSATFEVPTIDPTLPFSTLIVPTVDGVRTTYVMDKLLRCKKHVLVVGPTGSGKSLTLSDKLLKHMPIKFRSIFLNFSAKTSANQTQDMIDMKLDKRRKGIFGPPMGKQAIIFVDDLNMPAKEFYGAQPPLELLRQYMDHGGWYDRVDIGSFRHLVDVCFLGAMGPPGGGRNFVSDRLMRHFNFLALPDLSDDSRRTIFRPILQAYFKLSGDVVNAEMANTMVDASIDVYTQIIQKLLPTPAKVHYTFNLRDLAKIFGGILMCDVKSLESKNDFCRLWLHETQRVFRDRLINEEDTSWFDALTKNKLETDFDCVYNEVYVREPLLYGDFMDQTADPRKYCELPELSKIKATMDESLDDYNQTNTAKMKLVLFQDAMQHAAKISRIIRQPLGNALLLGVGGSGRQSMTRLAAYMADFDCFQIELSKNYGTTEWREDLKTLMKKAGLDNNPIVFLFSDTQIKSESFLEDINNILNSGDVPGIYETPELDEIYSKMKPVVQAAGLLVSKSNMFATYCARIRANVHTVICMSPIGEVFRARLRQFPALVNCCTIDWFSPWPDEALRSVASTLLNDIPSLNDPAIIEKVTNMCVTIHQSAVHGSDDFKAQLGRVNYVTPTAYLSLLDIFGNMIGDKRKSLQDGRDKTANGMTKLQSTEKVVAELQVELTEMQPALKVAKEETEAAMVEIAKNKADAEVTAVAVGNDEKIANEKKEKTEEIAASAQADLDEALPALDKAIASLKSLKVSDITELKAFTNPPQGVKMVMEGVCIMKGIKPKRVAGDKPGEKIDDYWPVATPLLGNPKKFLESLFGYDKENIPDAIIKKIKPYIDNPAFTPENIKKVSEACTAICSWVRAMDKYYHVSKMVAPKRQALAEAKASLEVTMKALNAAKDKLAKVNTAIAAMETDLKAKADKKQQLEDKAEECSQRLVRAEKLINGLGGEKVRWADSIARDDKLLVNVVGDIVVSAGTVAYLGPFTEEFRAKMCDQWRTAEAEMGLARTEGADLVSTLSDAVQVRAWQISGLPKDAMSTENACIVKYSERWPLFIDPQAQANNWIRSKEGDKLVTMKLTDRDFLRSLENAVRFGSPCLLENVGEELDPALEPILLKQTYKQAGGTVIKLGESVVPYHEDFKFYITTKMPNPLYTPEVSAKVTVINFTLSPSGLEDQMLGLVVATERPDLEEAKNELIVSNAQNKADLKSIEDLILRLLSECVGSPVDDVDLIKALEESKIKSDEINAKVAVAEETEKTIDETRLRYVPVAVRTQLLFFCTGSLAQVDPMYQYSLDWFRGLFVRGLAMSEKCDDVEQRIANINDYVTFSLYSNVCRSLFERHKLLFSFLLCISILMNRGEIDADEWRYLITGGTITPEEIANPAPDWISERAWKEILTIPVLPTFKSFAKEFVNDLAAWKAIFDSPNPHKEAFPSNWQTELNSFQKLLVMRCLRYDKLPDMMQDFVADKIGQKFIEPQTANLSLVFPETNPWTPIIFVLSNGTDPAADLQKFAEEMKMTKKLESISLGQGQGPKAKVMFDNGIERGSWVFFQNCHLAPSWMPALERMIEDVDPQRVHRDFRLWLTSMPTPKFPVPVLQNGSKLTVEPPRGIKANLLNIFDGLSEEDLVHSKENHYKVMLLSLCIFHGVLLERRKYGPLGFNIPYGYTQSDLQICMTQLRMFLDQYEEPPFKVLVYTAGHINYGGRVTDDWDRRFQLTSLANFYNPGVLNEGYKFSPSGVYTTPPTTDLAGYIEYIRQRPINDKPEMFGLHENANITYSNNETDGLLAAILRAGGTSGGGGGGASDRDKVLAELANDIIARVPKPFDAEAIAKRHPVKYEESMNTVLQQEVIRFNKLLRVIHSSLTELLKALKGLVVMSADLELASSAMFNNQVPDIWTKKAYPSLKPLASWTEDLIARCDFIQKWDSTGIPAAFWISGFYFPQAFLTGSLQNYARKKKIPIDTLSFDFKVLNRTVTSIKAKPVDGCYIYGLFLEGARWDAGKGQLEESKDKELFMEMAPILLEPVENRVKPADGIYDIPCYKTLRRAGVLSTTGHSTNFVLALEVPTSMPQAHWINRGVALFCALNY